MIMLIFRSRNLVSEIGYYIKSSYIKLMVLVFSLNAKEKRESFQHCNQCWKFWYDIKICYFRMNLFFLGHITFHFLERIAGETIGILSREKISRYFFGYGCRERNSRRAVHQPYDGHLHFHILCCFFAIFYPPLDLRLSIHSTFLNSLLTRISVENNTDL